MNPTITRVPDVRDRSERRGICSHCGWYEDASDAKTYVTPGEGRVGAARSTAKYRIVM